MNDLKAGVPQPNPAPLADEIARLRETNKRLNRRCQLAEAAANLKVEQWGQRSKGAGRAYIYALGKDAASAALLAKDAEIARLTELAKTVATSANQYRESAQRHLNRLAAAEASLTTLRAEQERLTKENEELRARMDTKADAGR